MDMSRSPTSSTASLTNSNLSLIMLGTVTINESERPPNSLSDPNIVSIISDEEGKIMYKPWDPEHILSDAIAGAMEYLKDVIMEMAGGELRMVLVEARMFWGTIGRDWPLKESIPVIVVFHDGPMPLETIKSFAFTYPIHMHDSTFTFLVGEGIHSPLDHALCTRSPISLMQFQGGDATATIGGLVATSLDLLDPATRAFVITAGHMISVERRPILYEAYESVGKHFQVAAPPRHLIEGRLNFYQKLVEGHENRRNAVLGAKPETVAAVNARLASESRSRDECASLLEGADDRSIGHVVYGELDLIVNGKATLVTSISEPARCLYMPPFECISKSHSVPMSLPSHHPYPIDKHGLVRNRPRHYLLDGPSVSSNPNGTNVRHDDPDDPNHHILHSQLAIAPKQEGPITTVGTAVVEVNVAEATTASSRREAVFSQWKEIVHGTVVQMDSWRKFSEGCINDLNTIVIWNRPEEVRGKDLSDSPQDQFFSGRDRVGRRITFSREFTIPRMTSDFGVKGTSGGLVFSMEQDASRSRDIKRPLGLVSGVMRSKTGHVSTTIVVPLKRVMPRVEQSIGSELYFVGGH
ncbi:hypothetical protein WG66_004926 [Moniliophthora roreri]|nr:hypothetical protein WG66_004926 [Moniliophthora roreri]